MRNALVFLALWPSLCAAQYVANAVGSSSSAENVLAPAMLATIQTGYTVAVLSPVLITGPILNYGPSLASVLIRPAGSLQAIPATITSQNTFLVPAGIPQGTAELLWQYAGATYQSLDVKIAPHNFELTRNGPNGSAAIASVGLATPAQPGQTISLTGSGLGYGTQVTAAIGGLPATVVYAGRGTPAGMDLIQLQIPTGVADGCYVPLVLNIGQSVVSSAISVTSTGAPCRHPWGLSLTDLKNLDAGGVLNVAQVSLSTALNAPLSSNASRQESAYVNVSPLPAAQVAASFIPGVATGCSSSSGNVYGILLNGRVGVLVPRPPSLGAYVTLSTPTLAFTAEGLSPYYSVQFTEPREGTLASPPAPRIAPGKWTLTTPGSPDLPPSTFAFNVPAPVQLTSDAPTIVAHTQAQTLTWNGAGYDPAAIAAISLSGPTQFLSCTTLAQAGTFTIPASFLAPFNAGTLGTLTITVSPGPSANTGAVFQTTAGTSLAFTAGYVTSDTRPVDFP
jgi:hypothetical protein